MYIILLKTILRRKPIHDFIQKIVTSHQQAPNKLKFIEELRQELKLAEEIIKGKYTWCEQCEDYYLSKSFLSEVKHEDCKICTFVDPINSSGNTYVDGVAQVTYSICPKGHRKEIHRHETKKNN